MKSVTICIGLLAATAGFATLHADQKALIKAAKEQNPPANRQADWRDANRSWHGKVECSQRGGDYADNAQIVVADDGTWVCAWPSGSHEGSGDMQIVFSLSTDKGSTWSDKKPIEPSTKNNTLAYVYLFKSPVNGRIFSIYRFHDHAKVMSAMKAAGQDSSKTGGHFRDTAGDVAFR